jgi:predicted XRE-type DNA-binding protein
MKNRMVKGEQIREGSDNVFADLGLPNSDERLLKAQLMLAINSELALRGLTQEQAKELVGLTQPELSRIANGRGTGFSVERLMLALCQLGRNIEIIVTPAAGKTGELHYREAA